MKVICISDTHTKHRELKVPNGDILIHAGDIGGRDINTYIDFNKWIGDLPHKYKIIIAGNHDSYIYYNPTSTRRILTNCIYLENESCIIEGLKIWGSPISPTFKDWFFMANRGDEISKYWDLIPKDTDILITHSPSLGILDKMDSTKESLGCWDLKRKIQKIKPKLHIYGHIHGAYGIYKGKYTTYINASSTNEFYEIVNKPVEIEI